MHCGPSKTVLPSNYYSLLLLPHFISLGRKSCSFRMEKGIGMGGWLNLLVCSFLLMNTQIHGDTLVPITILERAISKGAVCLDGTAPAYSYVEGYGNGSDSWIVYLEGGGWCSTPDQCYDTSNSYKGSSDLMDSQTTIHALLDSDCTFNPHFCNWHKVYIYYCDGSSFMSNIWDDPKRNLYYRGMGIFDVMMEEMLAKGMQNATQAILTGSSSGALATLLHCDKFGKLFPNSSRVKCISDCGFLLHGKGHQGEATGKLFANLIKTHELANSLPPTCTSKMNSDLCLFPEHYVEDIQTPLFLIESAFDQEELMYFVLDRNSSCANNINTCNSTELGLMRDFRTSLIKTLLGLKKSPTRGMFVHSCYLHTHFIFSSETWLSISVANKTIEQAVADWYFDRSFVQIIDTNDVPLNCTNILSQGEVSSISAS